MRSFNFHQLFSSSGHPALGTLSEARRAIAVDPKLAAHVRACAQCRESLAFLEQLAGDVAALPAPAVSSDLKERVLARRARGDRTILPAVDSARASSKRRKWMPVVGVAAATLVVGAGMLLTSTPDVEAGAINGTMTLSSTTPRNGEQIAVRFRPGALLGRFPALRVRARVRTKDGQSYTAGVPVITVAQLVREKDGSLTGAFTLPDSIVFAALAVEDTAATEVDDNGGRTWEVMRSGSNGKVIYDAFEQRLNDLMGRNWEEGYATARRLVAAYPDEIGAWSWLKAFNSWMGIEADSIAVLHSARVAAFDRKLRAQPSPSSDDISKMYWYASRVDSVTTEYWRQRLLREAPTKPFAIQVRISEVMRKMWKDNDTATALVGLERIWPDARLDRREQVAGEAVDLASGIGDTTALRRWTERLADLPIGGSSRSSSASLNRYLAMNFVRIPSLRAEGLQKLRAELARLSVPAAIPRALDETNEGFHERLDRSTRATYAALGKGLVLDGKQRAALDTLSLAAAAGWNVDVFRDVRTASLAAGDTTIALAMSARLAADPRTTPAQADSLTAFGTRRLGVAGWRASVEQQRREFVERTLGSARRRSIVRPVNLVGLDGNAADLREMTKGKVTVVVFWSRYCGPAIEAIPAIHRVAERLGKAGIPVLTIVEETKSSAELTDFLKKHSFTLPVLLDTRKQASQAFNQWGTPYFYVVDTQGRIVFDAVTSVDDLLVKTEAVRLERTSRSY